jgi:hypothetical protein
LLADADFRLGTWDWGGRGASNLGELASPATLKYVT